MKKVENEEEDNMSSMSQPSRPQPNNPTHNLMNSMQTFRKGTFGRTKTRIDAVETSNLGRYCQQARVYIVFI
jgi:hypothetical protein